MPVSPGQLLWSITIRTGDIDIISGDDQGAIPTAHEGGIDRGLLHVFTNDGSGHFTDTNMQAGVGVVGSWMGLSFGDLNCDQRMDFFASNAGDYMLASMGMPYQAGGMTTRWFLGQDGGTFADPGVGDLGVTSFGWGTVIRDYDNDGDSDIIFSGGLNNAAFVEAGIRALSWRMRTARQPSL